MAWRALISRRLHELRIVCCPESPASAPVRSFLANNYEGLKTLNPKFPFLVRTGEADPYFLATYGYGHTEKKSLAGLDEAEVVAALQDLVALGEAPAIMGRLRGPPARRRQGGLGAGTGVTLREPLRDPGPASASAGRDRRAPLDDRGGATAGISPLAGVAGFPRGGRSSRSPERP
ncbi:hypothetical protein JL721_6230 [Aureococcus anophagefferens]|nr:hypothetical protein JL721_6230 [Aureococcus anophagefferens]